ncbi:MAG: ParB/RepB/Spo0J family partition protein [Hominimerdicola sp.]
MSILPKVLSKAFIDEDEAGLSEKTNFQISYRQLGKIIEISTSDIVPNPSQPRRHFAMDELTSLAKSISQDGIIQPLTVRKNETGFELVSGERRLRAAKMAGLKNVPCIMINADEERSAVLALIENIQRSDLNFFEEASGISKLIKDYKLTQEEIAVRLGLAQSTIANKLRILKLSKEEQQIILKNNLTERHARALLKISDEEQRKAVLVKIAENSWNVETTEKYILTLEREVIKQDSYRKRSVMLKDIRLFFNTINKAVNVMKLAGVEADTQRINHDDYIEYIIKIPSGGKENINLN